MKILMIVPHYPPDLGPSAPLFSGLAQELSKRGHSIFILTTVPHYPSGIVPKEYRKSFIQKEFEKNIEINRIRIPSLNRTNLGGRFLQFLIYQIGATWVGLFKKYDLAFVANPGLWVWLPFFVLCVLRRKPSVFSVYDVYPDVGIKLGIFRSTFVIKMVTFLEKYCLNHSSVVRIISNSFKPGLLNLGIPETKINLIYDWVDIELIKPLPKSNSFSIKNDLVNNFVVLYAGNMGYSQGLDIILKVANDVSNDREFLFLFVGDGSGRIQLIKEAEKLQLSNIHFLPFQPREILSEVLASADVSLVVLKKEIGFDSIPSKILSILASSRPLVASIDEGCEAWSLIEKADAGLCVHPENPDELKAAIVKLKEDKELCEKLGKNGRLWVMNHHSPQVAAENFEKLFYSILK